MNCKTEHKYTTHLSFRKPLSPLFRQLQCNLLLAGAILLIVSSISKKKVAETHMFTHQNLHLTVSQILFSMLQDIIPPGFVH